MLLLWLDLNSSYAHSSLALPAIHAQVEGKEGNVEWRKVSATINSNTLTSVAPKPAGTVRLLATVTPNPATSMNITRIDTGKATNDFTDLTGKAVALSTNLTVSDTATTISNAYVLFTFTDTYAGEILPILKLQG